MAKSKWETTQELKEYLEEEQNVASRKHTLCLNKIIGAMHLVNECLLKDLKLVETPDYKKFANLCEALWPKVADRAETEEDVKALQAAAETVAAKAAGGTNNA